jgi:prepilin-type processing-associated H-X9-DG protein
MNADELIESILSKGDHTQRDRVERALREAPEQAARVERLRHAIHRLLDDGSWFEHPPGLGTRTVAFVARHRRRPFLDYVPIRVPFRWADFAVAASIFVAGVLTLLPAIQRSRDRMNQAGCVFNLQQLGNSLAQYASLQEFLPYPARERSDSHTGMFAVMLHDAGVLRDVSLLDCPCNGRSPHVRQELAAFDQVDQIRRNDPERYARMLCWDYAYNVGYRNDSGQRPVEVVYSAGIPILADAPDHENFVQIREGNSPNHGGKGQNVLFGDGSVRWFRTRVIDPLDPDLYLNNERQARPGVHVRDSVLMPSKVPFRGR